MAIGGDVAREGLQTVDQGGKYIDCLANRYIVSPRNARGIGGFVFDYEGETAVRRQSDITDHWLEDNTAVQDHVAQKPARITMRGFVAELVLRREGVVAEIAILQNKLTTVNAYLGSYTPGAVQTISAALTQTQKTLSKINRSITRAKNIVGFFSGSVPSQTAQQKAYAELECLYETRQVFVVITPFKIFDNMLIESLNMMQPEETKFQSDIIVTLKQIRMVEVINEKNLINTKGGRLAAQAQSKIDKGKTPGVEESSSAFFNLFQ